MKTLLRYPGAKSRMLPILRPYLSELIRGEANYVEPFAGGGSVGLEVAKTDPRIRLHLNDKDERVASLWQVICGKLRGVEELCRRLDVTPTVSLYHRIKESAYPDTLGKAFKCVFLNRTSFNGVLDDSSCLGGAAQQNWSIGHRYKPDVLARLLHQYHSLLAGRTTVSCEDALDLIDRHRDWPTFDDPPYFPDQKRNKLYGVYMTREEHERLIRILAAVRKCVVTYDYSEAVRDMFQQAGFSLNACTGCYSPGKTKHGYVIDDGTGSTQSQWKSKIELIATKGIRYQGCAITPIAAAGTEPVGTTEK